MVAEYGDAGKVARFLASFADVATALLDICLPFGRLRWLACRDRLAIDFKPLSPARFVDARTWTVDGGARHAEVVAQGHFPATSVLEAALSTLGAADPWLVVQGHDLVHVLSIGFAKVLGTKEPVRDRIGTALRPAVDRAELQSTPLWARLRAWETRNVPYVLLA